MLVSLLNNNNYFAHIECEQKSKQLSSMVNGRTVLIALEAPSKLRNVAGKCENVAGKFENVLKNGGAFPQQCFCYP